MTCRACKQAIDLVKEPLNMLVVKGPGGEVIGYEHLQCPDQPAEG
jgi:hypothetical protein